jgi:DNA-binding response OmpR family regulator
LDRFIERPADLVIMDIMMPVMDGWELCQRLRQITEAPIIMVTARGQDYDKVKGFKLGADDYLVKPFSLRELAERVAALLPASR